MHATTNARTARSRKAGVLVWLVIALAGILGIVALSLDGGRIMDERRRAQATADAAALAAGIELYENYAIGNGADVNGAARKAALSMAARNGFPNDGTASIVTVNIPPKNGLFAGKTEYVEVIVQSNVAAGFSAALNHDKLVVKARSVARGRPKKIGMVILDPSADGALSNQSKAAFALLFSSVYVNSDSPSAFIQNSSGIVAADSFEIVGGFVNSGGGAILGTVNTGVSPAGDPLRKIPAPDPSAFPMRSAAPLKIGGLLPVILQPGVYRGGISINGLAIVTLLPGTYILDGGGLDISGLATVLGVGVTIHNTSGSTPAGPIKIGAQGKLALVAPLAGPYRGISIFQDRLQTTPISVTGNGLTAIVGTIYAMSAPVNLTSNAAAGVDILGNAFVCNTLTIGGLATVNVDLGFNRPAIPEINLVE